MKRTVVDCDRCEAKEVHDPVELSLCIGREMDPAGSMENEYKDFDLCPRCAAFAFRKLKDRVKLSHEDARWLIQKITSKEGLRPCPDQ